MSKGARWLGMAWKVLGGVLVMAFLAGMMLWLAGTFRAKVAPGPPVPEPEAAKGALATAVVARRTFPMVIEQVGTIQTQTEAQVASRIMAQVREILVKEGDAVTGPLEREGEATVLARLDDREVQAKLRQAQSEATAVERGIEAAKAKLEATRGELDAAKARVNAIRASIEAARAEVDAARARSEQAGADFARYEELFRQKAITAQQLDNAKAGKSVAEAGLRAATQQLENARAQLAVAEAQVRTGAQGVEAARREIERLEAQRETAQGAVAEANVMLSYTVIRAPLTGRVVRKKVEVGNMVGPGQPLFVLETPSRPELHAVVSESLAPRLRVDEALEVRVDALKRTVQGRVREILPQADPATRTVLVKVSLPPQPELVSGLFGRLRIVMGSYEALVIPPKAVRRVGQLTLVDVLDAEGKARRRFVTLGHAHEDAVEVASGLEEGERVVLP